MRFLVSGVGGDIGQSISRVLVDHFPQAEVLGTDIHDEFLIGDVVQSLKILPSVSSSFYEEST